MPRFRVTATITCSKYLVGLMASRIRKEVKKTQRRGIEISLDDMKVKELD